MPRDVLVALTAAQTVGLLGVLQTVRHQLVGTHAAATLAGNAGAAREAANWIAAIDSLLVAAQRGLDAHNETVAAAIVASAITSTEGTN